jgi:hypothetical protein
MGDTLTGMQAWATPRPGEPSWDCPVSGFIQPAVGDASTATRIRIRQPACPHQLDPATILVETDYDLGLAPGGQSLSGTWVQGPNNRAIALQRQ